MKKRRFTQQNKFKLFIEKFVKSNVLFYKSASILKTYFFKKFFYESDLDGLKLIKFKKSSTCIDVGSNVGQSIEVFKHYFSKIYGFEPYSKNYQFLKKRYINKKNIIISNLALSDKKKIKKLYIPIYKKIELHQSSSFYKNEALNTLSEFLNLEKKKINFKVRKITSIRFDNLKIKKFSFLKIDAEGHEYEILRGFGNLLRNDIVILVENSSRSFRKCRKLLEKKDFYPYSFQNNSFKRIDLNSLNVYFFKKKSKYMIQKYFY